MAEPPVGDGGPGGSDDTRGVTLVPTRTADALGALLDAPPTGSYSLAFVPFWRTVAERIARAEEEEDEELATQLAWEMALLALNLRPRADYDMLRNETREAYYQRYGITAETEPYLRQRAGETTNPDLRVRCAELLLLMAPRSGRERLKRRLAAAAAHRDLVDFNVKRLPGELPGAPVLDIAQGVGRSVELLAAPGVLDDTALAALTQWVVDVAEAVATFQEAPVEEVGRDTWTWSWPPRILASLTRLPARVIAAPVQSRALALVARTKEKWETEALVDDYWRDAFRIEVDLRRHLGDSVSAETVVRAEYESHKRRAEWAMARGSGVLASGAWREAQRLQTTHPQFFESEERVMAKRSERRAWQQMIDEGFFKRVEGSATLRFEFERVVGTSTAEAVANLGQLALELVPRQRTSNEASLLDVLPSLRLDGPKVVDEARTPEEVERAGAREAIGMQAQVVGHLVCESVRRAVEQHGLAAEELVAALAPAVPERSADVVMAGVERLLAGDFISALHVLVPQLENGVREALREHGLDTSATHRQPGGAGSLRTDDATLSALLRLAGDDGTSAETVLSVDFVRYLDATLASPAGLNLRNKIAHGLIDAGECGRVAAGIVLHQWLVLAAIAERPPSMGEEE